LLLNRSLLLFNRFLLLLNRSLVAGTWVRGQRRPRRGLSRESARERAPRSLLLLNRSVSRSLLTLGARAGSRQDDGGVRLEEEEEEEEDIPEGEREMTQWRMGADQLPLEGGERCGRADEVDEEEDAYLVSEEEDAHKVGEDGSLDSRTEFLTAARVRRRGGGACVGKN